MTPRHPNQRAASHRIAAMYDHIAPGEYRALFPPMAYGLVHELRRCVLWHAYVAQVVANRQALQTPVGV